MEADAAMMSLQLTVQFVEMQDRYPCNEDIECKYTFNNYKVEEGDRIAIFKMGWRSLRNYVLFEWAVGSKADVHSVIFSRYDLPSSRSETDDLYQFCYISGENVVQGISTPFQIYPVESKPKLNLSEALAGNDKCAHLKQLLSARDAEIMKLKEENAILRESLRSIVDQRKLPQHHKNYDEEIRSLKELTNSLKTIVLEQQKEIDSIKIEMKRDKAGYKNLLLEKIIAEKKFEAISKKESGSVTRVYNFDLGNLQSIPAFPFETLDK